MNLCIVTFYVGILILGMFFVGTLCLKIEFLGVSSLSRFNFHTIINYANKSPRVSQSSKSQEYINKYSKLTIHISLFQKLIKYFQKCLTTLCTMHKHMYVYNFLLIFIHANFSDIGVKLLLKRLFVISYTHLCTNKVLYFHWEVL